MKFDYSLEAAPWTDQLDLPTAWQDRGLREPRVRPAAEFPPHRPQIKTGLTVLVPAYNEAASIADTIRSLKAQSLPIDEIIVIDDFSSDATGDVAHSLGV